MTASSLIGAGWSCTADTLCPHYGTREARRLCHTCFAAPNKTSFKCAWCCPAGAGGGKPCALRKQTGFWGEPAPPRNDASVPSAEGA